MEDHASRQGNFRPALLIALAVLLCVTVLVRLPAMDGRPLWIDELWRANLMLDPGFWHAYLFAPTAETAITSPLYAAFVKLLAFFPVTPWMLRLSSFLPGVLAPFAAFLVVRKAGGNIALALLGGLAVSLNPLFFRYSNEMKPYMLEVAIHLLALYAWLQLIQSRPPAMWHWFVFFDLLAIAILSSPTAAFLLPAAGLSLLFKFRADKDRRNFLICVAGFAGFGVLVATLYLVAWRHGAGDDMLNVWAASFPSGFYPIFIKRQLAQMTHAAFPFPHTAGLALAVSLLCLAYIAVTQKWRATPAREILLFYATLLATLLLLNGLRIWPLDNGRENLFLFAHIMAFTLLLAAQAPLARPVSSFLVVVGVLSALFAAAQFLSPAYRHMVLERLKNHGAPVERSDLVVEDFSYGGSIGRKIAATCAQPTLIVADGYMAMALQYYTDLDSVHRGKAALLRSRCVRLETSGEVTQNPPAAEQHFADLLAHAPEAWFVYTHLEPADIATLEKTASRFGDIDRSRTYEGGAGYFRLVLHSEK